MSVDADGTEAGSLQLQLYQAVPQHPDNLFPFTRVQPVHTVPSPFSTDYAPSRKPQKTYREHLAAHLEG
ncbi:hypothetical protein IWW36_005758, partial [Coemansia brasiliensis]